MLVSLPFFVVWIDPPNPFLFFKNLMFPQSDAWDVGPSVRNGSVRGALAQLNVGVGNKVPFEVVLNPTIQHEEKGLFSFRLPCKGAVADSFRLEVNKRTDIISVELGPLSLNGFELRTEEHSHAKPHEPILLPFPALNLTQIQVASQRVLRTKIHETTPGPQKEIQTAIPSFCPKILSSLLCAFLPTSRQQIPRLWVRFWVVSIQEQARLVQLRQIVAVHHFFRGSAERKHLDRPHLKIRLPLQVAPLLALTVFFLTPEGTLLQSRQPPFKLMQILLQGIPRLLTAEPMRWRTTVPGIWRVAFRPGLTMQQRLHCDFSKACLGPWPLDLHVLWADDVPVGTRVLLSAWVHWTFPDFPYFLPEYDYAKSLF